MVSDSSISAHDWQVLHQMMLITVRRPGLTLASVEEAASVRIVDAHTELLAQVLPKTDLTHKLLPEDLKF